MTADLLVRLSADLPLAAYVLAIGLWLGSPRGQSPRDRRIGWIWSAGAVLLVLHIVLAYHLAHHWSHQAALEHTARETERTVGRAYPAGLYVNFLFAGLWCGDAIWLLAWPESYWRRPLWLSAALHAFWAFVAFNATVVFATGVTRVSFALLTALLACLAIRRHFQATTGERGA